jgi:hypothetical protein
MRKILPYLNMTLAITLALLVPSVGRAGSVTFTLQPIGLTVAEGSDITLTFTVDNNSGVTIQPNGLGSSGGSFLAGDSSDLAFDMGTNFGTCGASSLASGASCTLTTTFHAGFGENVALETDADFALQEGDFAFLFLSCNVPDCSSTTFGSSNTVSWNLTVTDPGFTGTTPEPSSLLLFGSGLLGLLPVLRRFARV